MKKWRFLLITAALVVFSGCTDYPKEDAAPSGISVSVSALSFPERSSTQTITIRSGSKWTVSSIPDWVSVQAIDNSYAFSYEWPVTLVSAENDGYDRNGTIVFTASGETISVPVEQKGKKGTYVAVESVSLDVSEITLTEGDSYTLTATVSPDNASDKSVTWSSNNTSVATVSSSGIVTAISVGTAIISVRTIDGGKETSLYLTVLPKTISVIGVSLDKTSLSMTVGETQSLVATVTPSNATDKSVTWYSGNSSVATVSSSGLVTAIKAGSATIRVKTNDGGIIATCQVTVLPVAVTGVSLNKSSLTLYPNDSESLIATITPSNASNKSVSWSSSNNSIVTINSYGQLTALSAGSATITVTTEDGGKTASCSVSVLADSYVAVDLGLSVKWASSNYGASSITHIGGYFLYGDPTGSGKTPYYSAPNVDFISGTYYDIVRQNWGGNWRIPTRSEIIELFENCSFSSAELNGSTVIKITGPNGSSIYLPLSGYAHPDDGPVGTISISERDHAYLMSGESYSDGSTRIVYYFGISSSGELGAGGANADLLMFPIRPVR